MAGPVTRPWVPLTSPLTPHTHVEGLTKGIMAAKDGVGDRDQGWAGPFLPRGEVILGIVFRLRRGVQ